MLRAVMAGCGAMSKGWLRAIEGTPELAASVTVAGLVDLDEARAKAVAAEFNLAGAVCGSDLDAVLSTVRPDLLFDVVVPPARSGVVETGLKHGCHVLSEKPMATSLVEAERLIDLAGTAGRVHAVVQNRRYHPGRPAPASAVESGAIGRGHRASTAISSSARISAASARRWSTCCCSTWRSTHSMPRASSSARRRSPSIATRPTRTARGTRTAPPPTRSSSSTTASSFTYRGSWCAEGANTSWESSWRIIGTKGTLLWDGADDFRRRIVAGDETASSRPRRQSTLPAPDRRSRDPWPRQRHRRLPRRHRAAAARPRQSAPTTSRASPWCFAAIESARSRPARRHLQRRTSDVSNPAKAIRIGTMISAIEGRGRRSASAQIADLGFESFEPFFWQTTNGQDLAELGKRCARRDRQSRHHHLDPRHVRQSARGHARSTARRCRAGRTASTTRTISARPASPASPAASAASR